MSASTEEQYDDYVDEHMWDLDLFHRFLVDNGGTARNSHATEQNIYGTSYAKIQVSARIMTWLLKEFHDLRDGWVGFLCEHFDDSQPFVITEESDEQ